MANEIEYNENNLNEQTIPDPPKDENGNPLPPPEGGRPPMHHGQRPPEPPKDDNGNPLPPPEGGRHHGYASEEGETSAPATGETT